jgi:hypothetical protein
VKIRPVPPYVLSDVHSLLPEPPFPKVTLTSPAGTEILPALPETPEYEEYRTRRRAHDKWVNQAVNDFALQFGVVEWSWDKGETWESDPPKDWKGVDIAKMYGLTRTTPNPFDDRRLQYIKQELVVRDMDSVLVNDATLGAVSAITEQEVKAAMAPFGSETPMDDL